MAFCSRSLSSSGQMLVGGVDGVATQAKLSERRYATNDAAAVVEAAGYFNDARAHLTKGDVILAVMAVGSTPVLKLYVATAVPASGDVTIARLTTTAG